MNAIDYRRIPVDELILNKSETARRLCAEKGFEMPQIDECFEELKKVVECRFAAMRCSVEYKDKDCLDIGFGEFKSSTLKKNLKESNEAFVFAVTLGHGVDRLLVQLSFVSPAKHFITDALASSMAESAANLADKLIKGDIPCRPRFSPGFGDLSLELQPRILDLLNAQRILGITTNTSFMMSPGKSVTAIMGIKK